MLTGRSPFFGLPCWVIIAKSLEDFTASVDTIEAFGGQRHNQSVALPVGTQIRRPENAEGLPFGILDILFARQIGDCRTETSQHYTTQPWYTDESNRDNSQTIGERAAQYRHKGYKKNCAGHDG